MSGRVSVWVLSADTRSERRLDLDLTVQQLKIKFEHATGIPAGNQRILLFNGEKDSVPVAELSGDDKDLAFYALRDWQVLKVEDKNPSASSTGQWNDFSQVEKFELSGEAYADRQDSVLAFKQRHRMGRFAPKEQASPEPPMDVDIAVGSRCEVDSAVDGFRKRGTVRFVGPTKFTKGIWVGVEYDEPIGKNDGSVEGERYFQCRQNYGVFVKPTAVKTGDFPEEDINLDEEM